MSGSAISSELLREVIREVVREVLREVVAEEVAVAMHGNERQLKPVVVPSPLVRAQAKSHFFNRGALTERHVRAAEGEMAIITITRKVVVTPLAQERAKTSGIEIVRIEE